MVKVWIGQGVWGLEAELSGVDGKFSQDDFSALQGRDRDCER